MRPALLTLAFACMLAQGCTTSALDLDPQAGPGFAGAAAGSADPQLPETTAAIPSIRSIAPARAAPDAGLAIQAYGGPTPTAPFAGRFGDGRVEARSQELDTLIERYAAHYEVPVELVRRVVHRESRFNPAARNGPYWGLMQIRHDTARSMGYRGSPEGLLDAETNLNFAVRYLRGAYITAGRNQDRAVRFYASGYYYHARDAGLLEATGLGKDRRRRG